MTAEPTSVRTRVQQLQDVLHETACRESAAERVTLTVRLPLDILEEGLNTWIGTERILAALEVVDDGKELERDRVLNLIAQLRKRVAITPRAIGWDRALTTLAELLVREV